MVVKWINDLANALIEDSRVRLNRIKALQDPDRGPDAAEGETVDGIDGDQLVEGVIGGFFDTLEDDIIEELQRDAPLTPENIDDAVNDVEGAAIEDALTLMGLQTGIEIAGLGQIETHEELSTRIMSFLVLQDVVGKRLEMFMAKGAEPALEAEAAKQTRSEFVSLQDAVEYALRTKDNDDEYLTLSGASDEAQDRVGSVNQVSADNLLEEWGIRDDNLDILELVALNVPEFEELIETPTEFGVIIDDEVVEQVLQLSGYPEDLKDAFREVADGVACSTTVYEERTAYEELVNQLDEVAADGEIDPEDARPLLDGLDDTVIDELVERWDRIQDVPQTGPPRTLIESSFAWGLTDSRTLEDRLDRLEYDVDRYDDIVRATILDEIDGQLQEAFALGLLSDAAYGELMDRVGLDGEAQAALMAGQSFGDITDRRLQQQADPATLPVSSIAGIGESRAAGLRAAGIETVGDLAGADPADVAEAAQVESATAQGFIDQATLRTS